MSDRSSKTRIMDQVPPTDWHEAAPTLSVRWLVGVALVVPLLLAAGVYWLHHIPPGTGSRINDNIVEVRLISPQEHDEQRQEAVLPANQAALDRHSERLVEDPDRSIPAVTEAPAPSEPSPSSPSATTSAPESSAAPVRMLTNQIALVFQRELLSHIARYRHYPEAARRDRIQGTVQMVFAMQRDGTVTEVWIKSSSGHNVLDAAAVDTIRKAQPLPKIPADLPDRLNILVPVAFDLP
jgi:protein TonB